MWIFLSDSMLSIVQKPGDSDTLTVRARIKGDIERVFPNASVSEGVGTDYLFRARISREEVAKAICDTVMDISYSNFKSTTTNRERHNAYMRVWEAMYSLQESHR